ncbi:MAG: hypothetical protein EP312_06220 [Gammaproteobacteria bacterium]|nr:MAG: hypothetical protein EP312_06220 [Gammaproteobacteria bacterium]
MPDSVLTDILACPQCRQPLEHRHDWLSCHHCQTAWPVLAGFPCFGHPTELAAADAGQHAQLLQQQLGDPADYQHLIDEKQRRGHFDLYAAFQPFNESTRAVYPLLPLLQATLRPGDIILDTWCRTGYSAALLAGLFPQQQVIALWEGNHNVLGYRGFRHWFGNGQCPDNLHIVFTHADQPLPLANGSVRVVHGLDSLHRYDIDTFPAECLRVCDPEGVLVFPHIHLTNSEPDPWFDRGCLQWHGREWKALLDARAGHGRQSWVLAEPDLFAVHDTFTLRDDCDTGHYNGFALVAGRQHDGQSWPINAFPGLAADARLLENPLLAIDLNRACVVLDEDAREGSIRYMLDRHPVYRERLQQHTGERLDELECRLLFLARSGMTVQQMADTLRLPLQQLMATVQQLCERELVHPAPLSMAMFRLQSHYGFPQRLQPAAGDFRALWETALPHYASKTLLRSLDDGSEFSGDDVQQLVSALQQALAHHRITAGDIIAIQSQPHIEYLMLVWAAWLSGITVAAIDPDWPATRTQQALARLQPRMLWLGPEQPAAPAPASCVTCRFDRLDEGDSDSTFPALSEWLACVEESTANDKHPGQPHCEATAAILFTSGSTGEPKGVRLSQRSLCGSGTALARHYGWQPDDTLLLVASFHSMSGLRNPATAALSAGATIAVPGTLQRLVPVATLAAAGEATLLSTVPASLDRLCDAREREPLLPITLRQILCTGTPLSNHSRLRAQQLMGCQVANYYGLTETGGFCAGSDGDADDDHSIGQAVAAIMHITDENGSILANDDRGLLRVFSQHLMQGYLLPDGQSTAHDGWLHTGDVAYRDAAGHIHLCGRSDDMLKNRHGERLSPLRIENALRDLEGVTDAAVVAHPDGRLIAAFVASQPLDERFVMQSLHHTLGRGHSPDSILQLASLPRNNHGKLDKHRLLELTA